MSNKKNLPSLNKFKQLSEAEYGQIVGGAAAGPTGTWDKTYTPSSNGVPDYLGLDVIPDVKNDAPAPVDPIAIA